MGRDRTREFVLLGVLLAVVPIALSVLAVCLRKRRRLGQKRKKGALATANEGLKRGEADREAAGGLGEQADAVMVR